MSNTDQAPAAAAPTLLDQIEAGLSDFEQKVVAFFKQAELDIAAFLSAVASGAQILIAEVEAGAGYVATNLTVVNSVLAGASTLAATVAPDNTNVQQVIADLATSANDVAALHGEITTGISTGDPAIVTKTAAAITAVQQLATQAQNLSSTLSALAAASPTATQAVSPPTPSPNA